MSNPAALQLARDLARAKSPDEYHGALRKELAAFNSLQEALVAKGEVRLACKDGCFTCCHLRVDVRPPEIFLIAEYVRTRFSPEELAVLMERLAAHAEKVLALTPFEHVTQNVQCPILRDGRCSIYPVRPHVCRRYHSKDFAACQYVYDHPTDIDFPGARDNALFRGLGESMEESAAVYDAHGFDNQVYELGTALLEALTSPACWRRWRDKKKAFLRASVTPTE
ncbi:MAG: YkgJ family cysteine cluster protein [Verrucomicrobiota bacterium]